MRILPTWQTPPVESLPERRRRLRELVDDPHRPLAFVDIECAACGAAISLQVWTPRTAAAVGDWAIYVAGAIASHRARCARAAQEVAHG